MDDQDKAFYQAWAEFLTWMREIAAEREGVRFEKEGDFPDYIYRMERSYDLPTTVMSASLSLPGGRPVLLAYASPRHTVFKEVVLHPFDSHAYRQLALAKDGKGLSEGSRRFTRERLEHMADELFALPRVTQAPA
ncbi:MAG: NADH-quinone oxidoreductase subunit 15 [Trueperaceae bacterium]|nr:NADH-quinone oxidoreductase subunit 15 [Trueperaceae bacterium]